MKAVKNINTLVTTNGNQYNMAKTISTSELMKKSGGLTLVSTKAQRTTQVQQQAQEAQQKAKQASSAWGMVKSFVGALPEGILKTITLGGQIPKFMYSANEALNPLEKNSLWRSGKFQASQKTYDVPVLGPMKSYQSDVATNQMNAKTPGQMITGTLGPMVQAAATGFSMIPGTQAAFGDVSLGNVPKLSFNMPDIGPLKGGEVVLQQALKAGQVIPSQIPQITKDIYQSGKSFFSKMGVKNSFSNVLEDMTPQKPTQTQREYARSQGLYSEKGDTILPSREQKEIATTITKSGLLDNKLQPSAKINLLNDTANGTSEYVTRPYIEANSKPFEVPMKEKLIGQIESLPIEEGIVAENKAAINRINNIAKDVIVQANDTTGKFDGRIEFDNQVDAYYKKIYAPGTEPTPVVKHALQVRSLMNKSVASDLPDPQLYNDLLAYEHQLYRGAELINDASGAPKTLLQKTPWWVKAGITYLGGQGLVRVFKAMGEQP
jgi:hypothetical protein